MICWFLNSSIPSVSHPCLIHFSQPNRQVKKGYLCLAHGQIESDGPFRIDAKLSYSRENQESTVVGTGGAIDAIGSRRFCW